MSRKRKNNWLKTMILGLSSVLVLFTLGFLVYEMVAEEQTSPDLTVTYDQVEVKNRYFALPVKVTNHGAKTAEQVRIEVIAGTGDRTESSLLEFQYLPGQSSVEGWATFQKDPGKSVQINVLGYISP